jgi:hypothetical protein
LSSDRGRPRRQSPSKNQGQSGLKPDLDRPHASEMQSNCCRISRSSYERRRQQRYRPIRASLNSEPALVRPPTLRRICRLPMMSRSNGRAATDREKRLQCQVKPKRCVDDFRAGTVPGTAPIAKNPARGGRIDRSNQGVASNLLRSDAPESLRMNGRRTDRSEQPFDLLADAHVFGQSHFQQSGVCPGLIRGSHYSRRSSTIFGRSCSIRFKSSLKPEDAGMPE